MFVCKPQASKGFRIWPRWLNCISWEPGQLKVYRWLWWNWAFETKK